MKTGLFTREQTEVTKSQKILENSRIRLTGTEIDSDKK